MKNKKIFVTQPILPDIEIFSKGLKKIWDKKILSNGGPYAQLLEKKLTKKLKAKYLSIHGNGTLALDTAMKALNLKGEVIVTPFSFPATAHIITQNNLTPVFCDINYEDMVINHNLIESKITKKTTAILGVHVYGNPCNVEGISKISKKYNLKVIYDGAHSFNSMYKDKPLSSFGDLTMHSFHATKLFNTAEGGAIICNLKKLHEKIEIYRNFGLENAEIKFPGLNSKMNEFNALLGIEVLKEYGKEVKKRRKVRKFYESNLKNVDGLTINKVEKNCTDSFQYFVIRIDKELFGSSRDEVHQKLLSNNIFARRYFYPLMSSYPHYKNLKSSQKRNLPIAHKVENEVLSLPFYGDLSEYELTRISKIILECKK